MKLTETDKRIIYHLQGDLPVTERPFRWLADKIGLTEEAILGRIRALKEGGVIRRFGATLRHQQSGYPANVMVAWRVDEAEVEEIGSMLAGFRLVSHCYQRRTTPRWSYNLYTMVHGQSREDCAATVADMSAETGVDDYQLLYSRRELKKTSMRYFE